MSTQVQTQVRPVSTTKPSFTPVTSGLLQHKCACGGTPGVDGECAECRSKRVSLQRRATNQAGSSAVPPIVHDVLRSPGQPLDAGTRAFMEPRFGHDFSRVRVHTDARAAESAQSVNALAYTVGRDVVLGTGQYAPGTTAGQRLLAHELTHVLQQGNRVQRFDGKLETSDSRDAAEQEADDVASNIIDDQPFAVRTHETRKIARQELGDEEVQEEIDQANSIYEQENVDTEKSQADLNQIDFANGFTVPSAQTLYRKAAKPGQKRGPTSRSHPKKATKPGKKATPKPPPRIVIDRPTPNLVFNINATPQLPSITCRARIVNLSPDPTPKTKFNWRISITESIRRSSCASSRIGNCIRVATGNSQGGGWTPAFNTIQGGVARITATAKVGKNILQASVNVNIHGTNPSSSAISAECGGIGTDADHVACKESTRRQFAESGMPLLGRSGGGDVGIMQLCNPAASCLQRWNWKENVRAGRALLEQKRGQARTHLNAHRVNGSFPNSLNLSDDRVLQRETLQRYNRGSYWIWIAAKNQWEPNPPNKYAEDTLLCQ